MHLLLCFFLSFRFVFFFCIDFVAERALNRMSSLGWLDSHISIDSIVVRHWSTIAMSWRLRIALKGMIKWLTLFCIQTHLYNIRLFIYLFYLSICKIRKKNSIFMTVNFPVLIQLIITRLMEEKKKNNVRWFCWFIKMPKVKFLRLACKLCAFWNVDSFWFNDPLYTPKTETMITV